MRIVYLALAVASLAAAQGSVEQRVDALFSTFSKPTSPGCALAVIKDGQIIYKHGYGMADLAHDIPITTGTVFDAGSISKQFTVASIVMLAQEGKLSLDDPARKYIPELPDYGAPLTLRHLIHHTSGIKDVWNLLGLAGWRMGEDLYTDDDVLSVIYRQKTLNFKPGDKQLYSNSNYILLAQIVRIVSGQKLRDFTAAHIFGPLGMKNSQFRDDHSDLVKNMASGYAPKGATYQLSGPTFNTVGPTGLLTTVEDFALWDENFYTGRVGGPALIRQMVEKGKLNNGKEIEYAFGLEVTKYRGLPVVAHSGGNPGFRGDGIRFPEQHFSVVCFCNTDGVRPDSQTRKVADIYLASLLQPAPVQPPDITKDLTKEQLQTKSGLYWNKDYDDVRRVTVRDGKLFVSPGAAAAVAATTENSFRTTGATLVEYRFEPMSGSARPRLVEERAPLDPETFIPAEEYKPDLKELQQYVGRYRSDELDASFNIVLKKDKLFFTRRKFEDVEMKPTVRDAFVEADRNARFVRDAHGTVTGMILNQTRTHNTITTKEIEAARNPHTDR